MAALHSSGSTTGYNWGEPVPDTNGGSDIVLWKHSDDSYKPYFSSTRTWDQIRERKAAVFWCKGVWFAQEVPRFSFIVWLAARNRLSTGDRMRAWGIQQACVLCGEPDETRDHILFACPYSFTVWDSLVNRLSGNMTDPDWLTTLQFVTANNLQILDKILLKMAFQTSIYHIWKERNERRHQTGFRTASQVMRIVDKAVRNRITPLRYTAGHKYVGLMQRWFEVTATS
ncbi:uncharacterized protein LOC111201643 [Brassica napus]|uniref:uncharacterized protein LOC106354555 n=1 Tax=Brassica napus TaxID=3708 RepID=UPI0006AAB961|nr:uncharacterized protein LOC106354555 [Brassica napus]XP_022549588.1 uncharacterized protein LOC111201643 [Brassica napus]